MTIMYGKFQLPTKIKVDEKDKSDTFCRFIAEPFERGFGHTIGNALRRIILTSMESPAIVSFKMEGVAHEYAAVEGIIEDMTHVILNLKGGLLRKLPLMEKNDSRAPQVLTQILEVTQDMIDTGNGQYIVRLKDLIQDAYFQLVNPEHHIFTVTKPMKRRIDIKIAIGRGYVPSERHELVDKIVDEILVDSAFSPVQIVNYYVENTRVGQDTDFDRLILEIVTDGRVTPQEALSFATEIGILHFKIFKELRFQEICFDKEEIEFDSDRDQLLSKLGLHIDEIELSVRSTNCLSQANISNIAELVVMPESEMLKFRNFGKKSLNEIKDKLGDMGLHLGMDLSRFGITHENVKEIMSKYYKEKAEKEA